MDADRFIFADENGLLLLAGSLRTATCEECYEENTCMMDTHNEKLWCADCAKRRGFPTSEVQMQIKVGDILTGFCGGCFGRDSYDDKTVIAVGGDWVLVREDSVWGSVLVAQHDNVHDELKAYLKQRTSH